MRPALLCILLICGSAIPASAQQLKEITNSIGMKLVRIHAGSFTMGSRAYPHNTQHEITITNSFYLGRYEVLQVQFEKMIWRNPSNFNGAKNPVETVSWDEAVSFCKKLSEMPEEKAAGREYRLPTEAEWEYACRATSSAAYCFGDTAESLGEYGWFVENSNHKTHPVGEKKANRWGMYDMHGNVWEWCQDRYEPFLSSTETDPKGPNRGPYRVIRGGSWEQMEVRCQSVYRMSMDPLTKSEDIGFRVAMSLPVKKPESASSK